MAIRERPRGDLRCPKCDRQIASDHPYAWCIKCGTSLPADVRAQLLRLAGVKAAAAEVAEARRSEQDARTKELLVDGRTVPCPICGHDRFRTRTTVMASGLLAAFDMEWAGSEALNYVCGRCGNILWFIG